MESDHPHLIDDCLIHIFTFLNEDDLISASSVCKVRSPEVAQREREQQARVEITP